MAEALLFVAVGSFLTLSAASLLVAALALRNARGRAESVEERVEHVLREERSRFLTLLSEERRIFKEELEREREHLEAKRRAERLSREALLPRQEEQQRRLSEELAQEQEQRLEAQQEAERLDRECLLLRQEQGRLARELAQERAKHLEAWQETDQEREGRERERRARRDAQRRIEQLKQELRELREAQQLRGARRESPLPVPVGTVEGLSETRELSGEKPKSAQRAQETGRTPRPASFPETASSGSAKAPSGDKKSRLGVWHPHPDDGAGRKEASAERAGARSDAPIEMFRNHYDKYLENYRGYVELAEGLYRTRDNGEVPPGSPGEREWEDRLRRVNDGIKRTTARLDILEEHNPGLATDDERISRRAGLAGRYSELQKKQTGP